MVGNSDSRQQTWNHQFLINDESHNLKDF